jgi:anthranilate synthase component 1
MAQRGAARAAYDLARERLAEVLTDFERNLPYRREAPEAIAELPVPKGNMSREHCMRMVETAKEYIRAGEVFQVVPSMRFEVPFRLPPFALYRALRRLNPSPFLFFLDYGSFSVVGSSPGILVRARRHVTVGRSRARASAAPMPRRAARRGLLPIPGRAEH